MTEPKIRKSGEEQSEQNNKKLKIQENEMTPSQYKHENSGQNPIKLRNIETINKVVEGPVENLEWEEERDWDKVLREHKQRIEQEEQEKNRLLEKQRKKTEGWQLYNLCKKFLNENNTHWRKRNEMLQEEQERQERLQRARTKTQIARKRKQEKNWDEKLQQGLDRVSTEIKKQDAEEEEKKTRIELKNTRASLWKLRTKEQKLVETEHIAEIRKMEGKIEHVTRLLEKEKTRLLARDKNVRKSIKNNENKSAKQTILAEIWATYRWVTDYLTSTTEEWEQEKIKREQEEENRLLSWTRMTRAEKIETIIAENNRSIVNENNNKPDEKTENKLHQDYSEQTRIITTEIIDSMLQEVVQQEQQLEQIEKSEKPAVPKPCIEMKQPTLQYVLKNNIAKVQEKTPQKPTHPPPPPNPPPPTDPPVSSPRRKTTKTNDNTKNPSTKKTTQKSNNTKNNKKKSSKEQEREKTDKQLRGFWTAFAKKQKEEKTKSNKENEDKITHKKNSDTVQSAQDFVFESSPNPAPITEGPSSDLLEHSILESTQITKIEKGKLDLELPKLDCGL